MTRRKWLSHVVAAVSLTAFIVLGQSCATTETPEQARVRQQAEEARQQEELAAEQARQQEEARRAWAQDFPQYDWEGDFMSEPVSGGVRITRFTGNHSEVRIPSQIRGESVIEIGRNAFSETGTRSGAPIWRGMGITSVIIPDSVTHIGDSAFRDNPLTDVTIPDSIISISGRAFAGTQITRAIIPINPDNVATIWSNAFDFTPFDQEFRLQLQAVRQARLAELYRQAGQSLGNLAHTTWQTQERQSLASFTFGNGTFTRRGYRGQIVATGTFRVSGNTVIFLNSAGVHSEIELAGYRLGHGWRAYNRVF